MTQSSTVTPNPKKSDKTGKLSAIFLVIVIGGIVGSIIYGYVSGQKDIAKANVGDCAVYKAGEDKPYTIGSCDSDDAKYKVLGFANAAERQSCLDVAGTTRTVSSTSGTVCMTDKNADPQQGINTIKVGDCMNLTGNDAEKANCTGAEYKVLKRVDGTSKVNPASRCTDEPDTTMYYGWGIEQTGNSPYRITAVGYDRLFCLGPNQS